MAKKKVKIKLDPHNTRHHGTKNKEMINKSLEELGAGRSIVIDNEDFVVAGNGVYEQAEELGIKTRIIETDGSELVVIKRIDLKYEDEKRRKLAVADNAIAESSDWDFTEAKNDELLIWGIGEDEEIIVVKGEQVVKQKITFSEYLGEANNYVVLFFDNDIDWLQAQTHFNLQSVHSKRANGKAWSKGIGRVINGTKYLDKLKK